MTKVLFLYPGAKVAKPRLPMSVLVLAAFGRERGLDCRILDERLDDLDSEAIGWADVVGISSMSGGQMKSAIAAARRIRSLRPQVPLVWGGAHASAYPSQTAQSPLVDYVVQAEGEAAFVELVRRIAASLPCDDLPAVAFRRKDGTVVENPPGGQWLAMDSLPFPAYDLVDIRRYADFDDYFSYETSRGCPFRCAFCYVDYFHHRKWRGKGTAKVMAELRRIKQDLGVGKLYLIDDNVFCNKTRALEICRLMVREKLGFRWQATIRADILSRFSDDEMSLLRESGCDILAIGAESGSERVLQTIRKDITPEQTRAAVQKCVRYGIMPQISFVIGFPFEDEEDLEKTLDLYDDLASLGKNVEINGLFIYQPYVGTPMFKTSMEAGYRPSDSLEEWGEWDFGSSDCNPWLTGRRRARLEALSSIARFKYLHHRFGYYSQEYRDSKLKNPVVRIGFRLFVGVFAASADWRWKRRAFGLAWEWKLWRALMVRIFRTT